MRILRTSDLTGEIHVMELDVTKKQFEDWRGGMLLQDAFSNLNRDEREFIKSGSTKEEWDNAFGDQ